MPDQTARAADELARWASRMDEVLARLDAAVEPTRVEATPCRSGRDWVTVVAVLALVAGMINALALVTTVR